jgi:hypothetical protein
MKIKKIALMDIQEEEQKTQLLLRDLNEQNQNSERLKLTGLEIIGFLGAKLVIPIVSGFISRILYDKYKDMQTNSQAEEARKELLINQGVENKDLVDEETMIRELSERLVAEGYSQEDAHRIVSESVKRIKQKFVQ